MNQALIGKTGFVGSNLLDQQSFDAGFSSADIATIRGQTYDRIVCAGVSAVKWWANNNPEEDLAKIENLMSHLRHVRAGVFTLISTIDVYAQPRDVDETDIPSSDGLHAYGRNRLHFEAFVRDQFPNCHIVRLPALFGDHLKKNAIFDLMTGNQTHLINPAAIFQWYPVKRLAGDLEIVERNHLDLVHLACEPLAMGDIRARFFADAVVGEARQPAPVYDFKTIHAGLFGEAAPYMLRQPAIWEALEQFISSASVRETAR
jgi:dTDP-4-dehydrorhamnose reductase